MFYLFPVVLPITRGNVVKTFIIGLVALIAGLFFVTDIADAFTMAANSVAELHPEDASVRIPQGFTAGAALDFASSLLCWVFYHLFADMRTAGIFISIAVAAVLMYWNRSKNMKGVEQPK